MTSHNTDWLPRQFQNGGLRSRSFKTNFFRIADASEVKTSVSGKAECLLAIKLKSKLSGVTFSFNEIRHEH